jgi:hypothetical protein
MGFNSGLKGLSTLKTVEMSVTTAAVEANIRTYNTQNTKYY